MQVFLKIPLKYKIVINLQAAESTSDFIIDIMETDKNHIHLLIVTLLHCRFQQLVENKNGKARSNCESAFPHTYSNLLEGAYLLVWWLFACFIGKTNPETIRKCIENQG